MCSLLFLLLFCDGGGTAAPDKEELLFGLTELLKFPDKLFLFSTLYPSVQKPVSDGIVK